MWAAGSLSFLEEPCEHPSQGCLDSQGRGESAPYPSQAGGEKRGNHTPDILLRLLGFSSSHIRSNGVSGSLGVGCGHV